MTDFSNLPVESLYTGYLQSRINSTQTTGIVITPVIAGTISGTQRIVILNANGAEIISFTGQAADGELTGVVRGLVKEVDGASSAAAHGAGLTCVISNPFQLYEDIQTAVNGKVDIEGDTLDGHFLFTADDGTVTFRVPNMTTTARDTIGAPTNGMIIYNTTTGFPQIYDAGAWADLDTGSAVPNASTTVAGVVEIATQAEITAGTDTGGTGAQVTAVPSNLAVMNQNNPHTYAASTGSANAYVLTLAPAVGSLAAGQRFTFNANFSNTGAATLNVNGLGATTIKKFHDQDLANGDIESGQIVEVVYDGTNFQFMNPLATTDERVITTAYTYGDTIAVNDVLYLDQTDNKLKVITTTSTTWTNIVGVALEAGVDTDTGKRVLIKGKVTGASFSAINPTFSFTSGSTNDVDVNDHATSVAHSMIIDNSDGAECIVESVTIPMKKTGSPGTLTIGIGLCASSGTQYPAAFSAASYAWPGAWLAEQTQSDASLSGTFQDITVTFSSPVTLPANTKFTLAVYDKTAVDAANYFEVQGKTSTGTGRIFRSTPSMHWDAANATEFNYTFNMTSVDPWDTGYAVRCLGGTGTTTTIGDDTNAKSWARVIGKVLSATEWFFDLDLNGSEAVYFDQDAGSGVVPYSNDTLNFRPHRANVTGAFDEESSSDVWMASGILDWHDSQQDNGAYPEMAGIQVVAGSGTSAPYSNSMSLMSTNWLFRMVPMEQGAIVWLGTYNSSGSNPYPAAGNIDFVVEYSQN